ncbi:class F sortase [Jiangella asiatica]|uniref:class F sortase n=1 Tax=Jiangella asiatica TaxID=2530372 RepID=UPI0013A5E31E|nr:class F sortase [Jiangella asiatica]
MAAAALCLLVPACSDGDPPGAAGPSATDVGSPAPRSAPETPAPNPTPTPTPTQAEPDVADPVRVTIPAVDIDANVLPIAVDAGNVLVPPPYGDAGWWEAGPEPGEAGASVIAGHLDNADGPDVFYRLAEVEEGDEIVVTRADGGAGVFRVVDVGQYSQDAFPTESVYDASDDQPLLRLITCGGEYDRQLGRYRDNVVVFAERA